MGVTCTICPHACVLKEGKLGMCGIRTVKEGKVISLSYGEATSLALDPIEKKPLACFHPGSLILSYGSYGCNLRCPFCQNNEISMANAFDKPPTRFMTPEALVKKALALHERGNIGIAYTYNEPFIAWEYLRDCAELAHEKGLYNVVVTNGYVTPEIWAASLSFIDACNIDLKCYSDEGYRTMGAPQGFSVVRESIRSAYEAQVHVEVTTLVVPGFSDDEKGFEEECRWLASLDPGIPLHISRFFPCYKAQDKKPTERALLYRFERIASRYLNQVFLGNI